MTIPIDPEQMEMMAPIAKAMAVMTPSSVRKVMTMNMRATNIKQIRYSCFKNYTAPYIEDIIPLQFCLPTQSKVYVVLK
jgi:hypothetical protein